MAAKNFGQMKVSLSTWAREPVDPDIATDALNDGIECIWSRVVEAQIAQFVGGPVTVSFAAASERAQLVSVADPTAPLAVANQGGGTLPNRTPFLAYTIVTESGSETLMSSISHADFVPINTLAFVSATGIPTPQVAGAFGWNLYASNTSAALMCRQNAAPLTFLSNFIEPVTGFVDAGDEDGGPLPPTENSTADDVFYIRNLEVPLSSGGFKSWDNVSIDSMMFKWASRSLASSSEYQPYYWDLVNGRQLEIRPALGTAFPSARYFFIHKPRRISFDSATIPFTNFVWEEALRCYALAAWMGTQREWDAHDKWQAKGDAALQRTCTLLRQQDWDKNTTITPFMAGG